jgi:hypothetical protein
MKSSASGLEIVRVETRSHVDDWISIPRRIHADDPAWVHPLNVVERRRISRKHSPFFTFGDAAFFIAYRDHRPVGRISAQINQNHLTRYQDATGHFGFFDCVDDQACADALFQHAADWLTARGMRHMTGPFNLSVNEETGLLVNGFTTPPAVLMPHAAPWTGRLVETAGLVKAMDVHAFRLRMDAIPTTIKRLAAKAHTGGTVSVRTFDMRNYHKETELLVDIFNEAWRDNWSFVPFSRAEIDALIAETRPFMRDGWGRFVLLDGREVGVMFVLPDLNSAIAPFRGRLLPFNWARLVTAIYRNQWRSARIPLLGLRPEVQRTTRAPALLALLVDGFLAEARNYPLEWVEISWVLENNRSMMQLARMAAGDPVKTYRLYTRPLTG